MSYRVEYITCKVCGSDKPEFLGLRGNQEYEGALKLAAGQKHIVTNVVKCRECGFVYTNPKILLDLDEQPGLYESPYDYRSSIADNPLKIFNQSLMFIEKFTKSKGRILDVGAGKGEFMAASKERGWEAYGIEPSVKFRQYAKEKYGLDIYDCDLEETKLADNSFDVVTLNMVLEHVDEPHRIFSGIYRLLKKGGLLYIEVPNMESALLKTINFYYKIKGKHWSSLLSPLHCPYHCYGYRKATLKRLCRMHNFKVEKIIISGIGLRGFRSTCGQSVVRQGARDMFATFASYFGQGDILIALAIKQ